MTTSDKPADARWQPIAVRTATYTRTFVFIWTPAYFSHWFRISWEDMKPKLQNCLQLYRQSIRRYFSIQLLHDMSLSSCEIWHMITVLLPQRSQRQAGGYRRMSCSLVTEVNYNCVLSQQKHMPQGLPVLPVCMHEAHNKERHSPGHFYVDTTRKGLVTTWWMNTLSKNTILV